MPGLYAFGYRLNVGSDDLILPAGLEILTTGSWCGTFAYIFHRHRSAFNCVGGENISLFYWCALALGAANITCLAGMAHNSAKGTMINWWPRRHVPKFLGFKLVLDAALLLFCIPATKWAFFTSYSCEPYVVSTMKAAVSSYWMTVITSCVTLGFILRPVKVKHADKEHLCQLQTSDSVMAATRKTWTDRCHSVGRFLGMEGNPAFSTIATLFTSFFKEDADVVPTDLMVALLRLEKEQSQKLARFRSHLGGSAEPPAPWMDIATATHYMRFAAGSYGWPMYVFSKPSAAYGLLRVLFSSRYIPRGLPENVVDDNSLMANTTVIKLVTGISDKDIVYVTYHNKLFEIPFYVSLDHKYRNIVVSIRGSLSVEDWITNLQAFARGELPLRGVCDCTGHEGMCQTARYIFRRLTGLDDPRDEATNPENGAPLLDVAFQKLVDQVGPDLAKAYGLMVAGHSLGAGTASILTLLLSETEKYSAVRCFAFSPPGGLLSRSASQRAERCICSVVLGDDLVCRLGLPQIFQLKAQVFSIVRDCDDSKGEVLGNWFERTVNRLLGKTPVGRADDDPPSWRGDYSAQKHVEKYQASMQQCIDSTNAEKQKLVRLFLPGHVMYVDEKTERKSLFRWVDTHHMTFLSPDHALFDEVILSTDMVYHHMPWAVLHALQQLQNQA